MAATRHQLSTWFDRGVAGGNKRMVIKCDTFDMDEGDCCYPVYSDSTGDDLREEIRKNGDRLMEVYDLTMDKEIQMSESRAFHY
jgi:hypothetical protein